jgi:lysophospholipid hydrolase
LDFVTLIGLFVFTVIGGSYYIRFQFLSKYEELKELPIGKPDVAELHPDAQGSDDAPASFHGYLDEFLSAVKIFGFLEKPVRIQDVSHEHLNEVVLGLS